MHCNPAKCPFVRADGSLVTNPYLIGYIRNRLQIPIESGLGEGDPASTRKGTGETDGGAAPPVGPGNKCCTATPVSKGIWSKMRVMWKEALICLLIGAYRST